MTFEGPIGTPLDDDLVTGFGRDGSNGTHAIKPLANLITTCSNGFTKDVGKSKIEPIGFSLREKSSARAPCMFFTTDLRAVATYRVLLLRKRAPDWV